MVAKTLACVFALLSSQTWADEACLQDATSLLQVSLSADPGPKTDPVHPTDEVPKTEDGQVLDKVDLTSEDSSEVKSPEAAIDAGFEEARTRYKNKAYSSMSAIQKQAAVAKEAIKQSFLANRTADEAVAAADAQRQKLENYTKIAISSVAEAKSDIQAVAAATAKKTEAQAALREAQKFYKEKHANDSPEQKAAAQAQLNDVKKKAKLQAEMEIAYKEKQAAARAKAAAATDKENKKALLKKKAEQQGKMLALLKKKQAEQQAAAAAAAPVPPPAPVQAVAPVKAPPAPAPIESHFASSLGANVPDPTAEAYKQNAVADARTLMARAIASGKR